MNDQQNPDAASAQDLPLTPAAPPAKVPVAGKKPRKPASAATRQQVFVEGKESVSDYITPYGNLKMKVKTHRLEIITGMKSTIKIDYALYINNSWQSDNELMIRLEPAN